MTDTSSEPNVKATRSRLKYISARLKELNEEKARLTEERKALRATVRSERGGAADDADEQ
jgi:hypothetical protein